MRRSKPSMTATLAPPPWLIKVLRPPISHCLSHWDSGWNWSIMAFKNEWQTLEFMIVVGHFVKIISGLKIELGCFVGSFCTLLLFFYTPFFEISLIFLLPTVNFTRQKIELCDAHGGCLYIGLAVSMPVNNSFSKFLHNWYSLNQLVTRNMIAWHPNHLGRKKRIFSFSYFIHGFKPTNVHGFI